MGDLISDGSSSTLLSLLEVELDKRELIWLKRKSIHRWNLGELQGKGEISLSFFLSL